MFNPAPLASRDQTPQSPTSQPHISSVISASAQYGYIPGLDGLRALAVLMVIFAHMGFEHIVPGGFGVTVFFFISGFLITRLLMAETIATGDVKLKQFYLRRVVRLYPGLLFMMLITGVFYVMMQWASPSLPEIEAGVGYFTNVFQVFSSMDGPEPTMPWRHLWSLAVEEHFYLGFPVLLILMRKNWRALTIALAAIIAVCLVWRIYIALGTNLPFTEYSYMMTDTRMDSLAWGCLFSVVLHNAGSASRFRKLIGFLPSATAFGVLLLSFLIRDDVFRYTIRFSLQGASIFVLLLNLYNWKFLSFAFIILDWKPLANIGVLSYGLYLWHVPLLDMFARAFGTQLWSKIAAILVCFIVAHFSFRFVEKPFFKFREKLGSHVNKTTAPVNTPAQ